MRRKVAKYTMHEKRRHKYEPLWRSGKVVKAYRRFIRNYIYKRYPHADPS